MRIALVLTILLSAVPTAGLGEDTTPTADEPVMMEAFNVNIYGGKIPLIDGLTGKPYDGDHPLLFDFASSFNKLLLAYHRRIVKREVEHLRFRQDLSQKFEVEMNQLTESFELGSFALEPDNLLTRERAIVDRLIRKPFFRIKAVVAWDVDALNRLAPTHPDSKYARDIRLNPDTGKWERRILTRWEVFFRRDGSGARSEFFTDKQQGLNLDTLQGFHLIERGLPADVPASAFREVELTYPVFFSPGDTRPQELERLQRTLIANLHFIYDPFSWIARRDTRFRGGFKNECRDHIAGRRLRVTDREWFDRVLADYFSDVVTIKLQGDDEIYDYFMLMRHIAANPQQLGLGLDLLNWNRGEKRTGTAGEPEPVRLHANSAAGFRFVLIDAYQTFGDSLTDELRTRLKAARAAGGRFDGRALFETLLQDLTGKPYAQFAREAVDRQQEKLEAHREAAP